MFIVVPHHPGIHMRRVSNGVDDIAIQQFPPQPSGDGLCNPPAAAAELPIDRQYLVIHSFLPQNPQHYKLLQSPVWNVKIRLHRPQPTTESTVTRSPSRAYMTFAVSQNRYPGLSS